jgi:hypothetical protein
LAVLHTEHFYFSSLHCFTNLSHGTNSEERKIISIHLQFSKRTSLQRQWLEQGHTARAHNIAVRKVKFLDIAISWGQNLPESKRSPIAQIIVAEVKFLYVPLKQNAAKLVNALTGEFVSLQVERKKASAVF